MTTETSKAKARLAHNRAAMVAHIEGRTEAHTFRAPDGSVLSPDPHSPTFSTADGVWPMLKRAGMTWWHFHPARRGLMLAAPHLADYARVRPMQAIGVAAGIGAALVVLRPWKLLSVSGLAMALLRSTEFSSVALALARPNRLPPPVPHPEDRTAPAAGPSPGVTVLTPATAPSRTGR